MLSFIDANIGHKIYLFQRTLEKICLHFITYIYHIYNYPMFIKKIIAILSRRRFQYVPTLNE